MGPGGDTADFRLVGHGAGFQGFITRTSVLSLHGLAISILTKKPALASR